MKKRMISTLITLTLLISSTLVMPIRTSAASYSVANAIAYAQGHWNDGVGLCAEFVSRCVMAGGVNTGIKARVRDLWPQICSLTGLSKQTLKLDANGYATYALNSNILAKGDVVVQWCSTHNIGPHVLLCGGYDSNGYATFYAHNGAMNNKKYKLSVNEAYEHTLACDMGGQVIRLSTLDTGASSQTTYTPSITVSSAGVNEEEYKAKKVVSDTNATVVARVFKSAGVSITQAGMYLYDADGNLIKRHIENITNVPASQKIFHIWYDINTELGITLTPGTEYQYKIFGIFDGVEVADKFPNYFTTTGPTPTPIPTATPAPTPTVTPISTAAPTPTAVPTETPVSVPDTINVYFDANGGKCSTSKVKVIPGETIDELPIPTRSGYTFKGWYSDESLGGKKVGTNTKINLTEDVTLYAKWEKSEFEQLGEEYIFPFEDVNTSHWYHGDVKNAHKMGLINGKSAKRYGADDNMTYAEAIKLAACMHQLYETGEVTLTNSSGTWYQSYVDYAKENSIPWSCSDYNAEITRRDYVYIFYYALPESAYDEINYIDNIPDVADGDKFSDEIYAFYRAGILSGSDSKGTFNPKSSIKRSEVAAILSRMMDESARQKNSF